MNAKQAFESRSLLCATLVAERNYKLDDLVLLFRLHNKEDARRHVARGQRLAGGGALPVTTVQLLAELNKLPLVNLATVKRLALAAASRVTGIPVAVVGGKQRPEAVILARWSAIWAVMQLGQWNQSAVAREFGIDHGTVHWVMVSVPERREIYPRWRQTSDQVLAQLKKSAGYVDEPPAAQAAALSPANQLAA